MISLLIILSAVLQQQKYIYYNDVDNPASIDEIVQEIRILDDVDGDISRKIEIIEDYYSPNQSTIGDFDIVLGITDSNHQFNSLTITIRNVDIQGPILSKQITNEFLHGALLHHFTPEVLFIDLQDGVITDYTCSLEQNLQTTIEFICTAVDSSQNSSTYQVSLQKVSSKSIDEHTIFLHEKYQFDEQLWNTLFGTTNIQYHLSTISQESLLFSSNHQVVLPQNHTYTVYDIIDCYIEKDQETKIVTDTFSKKSNQIGIYQIVFRVENTPTLIEVIVIPSTHKLFEQNTKDKTLSIIGPFIHQHRYTFLSLAFLSTFIVFRKFRSK